MDYIDSHVHLDQIYYENRDNISRLQDLGGLPVSWSFSPQGPESTREVQYYLKSHQDAIHNIWNHYLECYYLAGVHPRNICKDLRPEKIRELVLPFLEDSLCLGIGEIGLEKAVNQEIEVLHAHLEMASEVADRGKIFGIHTPRGKKEEVTVKILELLDPFSEFKSNIVVDHCTQKTIDSVLDAGYWAGITLSPVKSGIEDVEVILGAHKDKVERIMLNTDSVVELYDDLLQFWSESKLAEESKSKLLRDNPGLFFGIVS